MTTLYYETFKGFTYEPWIEEDDDVRKIWHVIKYNDEEVQPNWFANLSPYSYASREQFHQAVYDVYLKHWVQNGVDSN